MGSLIRGLLFLIALVALLNSVWRRDGDFDAPRRPHIDHAQRESVPSPHMPRRGPLLPPPSQNDPVVEVESQQRRGASVGTGFAMHEDGLWFTARHVVQDCSAVAMRGERGWVRIDVAWQHPRADMAIVRTRGAPAHFALSEDPVTYEQNGYGFGYPQGRPGSVHGHLMGRTQMRSPGLFSGSTATVAWAEVDRQPSVSGTLGGISGGPLLDEHARVLGIIVAEVPRRGRFETLAPEVVHAVAARPQLLPQSAQPAISLDVPETDFGRVGDALRQDYAVTQIGCVAL